MSELASESSTQRDLETLARGVIDMCNRSDWPALRAAVGPCFAYGEAGTGRRIDDLDDLMTGWQRWKAAFPDSAGEVLRVLTDGNVTVTEVVWRGTQSGPMFTANGPVPPSDKRIQVTDRIWACWEDGLLVAEWHEIGILSLFGPLLEPARPPGRAATAGRRD